MSKQTYTTAQGKKISLDNIRLSNEDVIAVGNMKVNARGDQLGPGGVPEQSRQAVVNQYYNLHTPVVDSTMNARPPAPVAQPAPEPIPSADPLIDEQDQEEIVKPAAPAIRGKLADAVARTAVVNQELLKAPKQQAKDKGPSRI